MSLLSTKRRVLLCLLQSLALLMPIPALALSTIDTDKLAQYEQSLFGKSHPELTAEARLAALEKKLFGSVKTGSLDHRLAQINTAIGNKRTAHLMALAPQLDTSQSLPPVSPEPAAAPDFIHHNSDHARNAVLDAPQNPLGDLLQQAMDAHNQGNVALAERVFKEVLARDPENTDALYNLGAIAEEKGNLDGALMNYQAALKTSPQDNDIHQAIVAVQGKIDERNAAHARAAQQAQAAAAQSQQHDHLKKLASDAAQAYKSGNYDLAVKDLEQVAQQAPNDPDVHFGLAQAYRGKGDLDNARYNLNQALAIDPGNPQYQQALDQINQQAKSGNSGRGGNSNSPATAEGYPAAAPDFHGGRGGYRGHHQSDDSGPIASAQGDEDSGSSGSTGDITPFSSGATESPPTQYGYAQSNGGYGGGGMSSFIPGMGGGFYGGMGGSSRLQRAAMSGLSGAAMGAFMGRMAGGGMGRGAIMGGLMGLFLGGL